MAERNLEEEYFHELDAESLAKLKARKAREAAEKEREEQRLLHANRCGKCGSMMDTKQFRGIEIELCPQCGAVLLDAGELEVLAGRDSTDFFTSFFTMFGTKKRTGASRTEE